MGSANYRQSLTLRSELHKATEARLRAFKHGWSKRPGDATMMTAIGRIQQFLYQHPFADNERVKEWCRAHADTVALVMPANRSRVLARLIAPE